MPLEEWKVQTYSSNVHHQAQAFKNRLEDTVMTHSEKGLSHTFHRLAPTEGQENFARLAPIVHVVQDETGRIAFATPWSYPAITDTFEKVEQLHDPNSEYVKSGAGAYNRGVDRRIYNAAIGAAAQRVGGPEGTITTVNLPAGQILAHGSVGQTVDKITLARAMLGDACNEEYDIYGPFYYVYRPLDIQWMFADVQMTSRDYVSVQALMSGSPVQGFMGFNWVPFNVPAVNGVRTNVAYAKSAMGLFRNLGEKRTHVSQRNDLYGAPWQVELYDQFGAVRIDDRLVVAIEVDATATPS